MSRIHQRRQGKEQRGEGAQGRGCRYHCDVKHSVWRPMLDLQNMMITVEISPCSFGAER